MGKKAIVFWSSAILWFAVLWQGVLKDLIFITLGVGRSFQKIEEFPYTCKRIYSPLLESCEDIWLDEEGRRLYAACSTVANRQGWGPGGNAFNISARDLNDHVSVLNINNPGKDGMYGLHKLEITGKYRSSTGGKDIDLIGFDVEVLSKSRLRFWMVNIRPPVDKAGKFLDAKKVGANATIEVFEHKRGSKKLEFMKTIWNEALVAPNNIAATGNNSIFVTNDHNTRAGMFRPLQPFFSSGTVAYCHLNTSCTVPLSDSLKYPNGIVKPSFPSNTLYIAHSAKGFISFHVISPSRPFSHRSPLSISQIHAQDNKNKIKTGMPIDNLSIDSKGDIWVTGFPNMLQVVKAMGNGGAENGIPSSVFRVRRRMVRDEELEREMGGVFGEGAGRLENVLEKVVEDGEGRVLPAASTVVHDVKTGNLWLSGFASRFVTVCEPI